MNHRAAWATALALSVAACGGLRNDDARGPKVRRGVGLPSAPGQVAQEQPAGETVAEPSPAAPAEEPAPPPELAAPATQPEKPKEEKKRDFGAELIRMVGTPTACLAPRPADTSPKTLSIGLTVFVMPSGAVGRASAGSGALNEKELACVRARLESLRFGPPIEGAPFSVSATLELKQAPPAAAPAAKAR